MCFALVAFQQHPDYPFVLAANRDEYFQRAALSFAPWTDEPGVVGGRDVLSGGSWLALNQQDARLALVTNVREGLPTQAALRSRGVLVRELVAQGLTLPAALAKLAAEQHTYAAFNVLAAQLPDQLYYLSNRHSTGVEALHPGFYGLSNARLDTPWPKLLRGKAAFIRLLRQAPAQTTAQLAAQLFDLLQDTQPVPTLNLPDTGVGLANERWLSTIFIKPTAQAYGTRCSSVIVMDRAGRVFCYERSWFPDNRQENADYRFIKPTQ